MDRTLKNIYVGIFIFPHEKVSIKTRKQYCLTYIKYAMKMFALLLQIVRACPLSANFSEKYILYLWW